MTLLQLLAGKDADPAAVEQKIRDIAGEEVAAVFASGSVLADHIGDILKQREDAFFDRLETILQSYEVSPIGFRKKEPTT